VTTTFAKQVAFSDENLILVREGLADVIRMLDEKLDDETFIINDDDGNIEAIGERREALQEIVDSISRAMNSGRATLFETPGKPGCACKYGRRNDVAFHHETCPWRRARLAERFR
jgi:hypothetical protein